MRCCNDPLSPSRCHALPGKTRPSRYQIAQRLAHAEVDRDERGERGACHGPGSFTPLARKGAHEELVERLPTILPRNINRGPP